MIITTWTAHFQPEAWVNDNTIAVDPEGEQTWDCTAFAGEHDDYLADLADDLDRDDVFKADPAAPAWVSTWAGPFTIRLTRHDELVDPDVATTDLYGTKVIITRSAGTDNAVVVFIDTEFEPNASDGGPGLRVLINDDDTYVGKPYVHHEEEN